MTLIPRVGFKFPNQASQPSYQPEGQTLVRVHSSSPGTASINIMGPVRYAANIDFGLVSSRMAECLALIAAAKILKHNEITGNVYVSANNRQFVEYVLKETTPRKKDMQTLLKYLWQVLEPFGWKLSYDQKQRRNLQGGTTSKTFPQGLFPWLKVEKITINDTIYIKLPDCPAVRSQFLASVRTARKVNEDITVPINAEKVVNAWIATVTNNRA